MRIGIIGAGMAGLACAEGLTRQGHEVVLFDKGRGPGGRMSTRRLATPAGEAQFDHGAQYFTIRDRAFRRRVDAWIADGVVAPWPSAGPEAHVGIPAMNAPIRQMAQGQTVLWATLVTRLERAGLGWRLLTDAGNAVDLDEAVVAVPAEQASVLLAPVAPDLAARADAAVSEPCWTVLLAFAEPVAVAADCWRGDGAVGWAARNNAKPGRSGVESWVVQAGPEWSRRHLTAEPAWVAEALTAALSERVGARLPPALAQVAHRWRYARSGSEGSIALVDRDRRLGVCGDWLIGPRIEAAWLSGSALGERLGTA